MPSLRTYKIHTKASGKQSAKFEQNKRRKTVLSAVLAVLILVSGIYSLSKLSGLQSLSISNVSIENADTEIKASLEAAALKSLEGKYFGLFSKSNRFLYSKANIINSLQSISPRIESIDVKGQKLNELLITVQERTPAALICTDLPDFNDPNESQKCYFSDETGTIYKSSPVFSDAVYNRYFLPNLLENSTSSNVLGVQAITIEQFAKLQDLYEKVRSSKINPLGLLIKGQGEYELYFFNIEHNSVDNASSSLLETAVIYLNEHNGLENELTNLLSFWNHMISKSKAKKEALVFESIDLRYGSNVFYRLAK